MAAVLLQGFGSRKMLLITQCPAIFEYIPYRKNDYYAVHDQTMHAYFAGHGYAAVRVDLRGSGDSDGILEDEYLPLEQSDGIEVIKWLAAQPWCSGTVGMIGISWGGFNGLQIAAHSPKELGAVVSICSTDDRYADDVHYQGGCLNSMTMLSWASVMLAYNARPPDPSVVGDSWREIWLNRMENSPPFVAHGFLINAATSSGSRARFVRTSPLSPARSIWWVAGRTLTRTRSCGSSKVTPGPAKG